MTRWIVALMAGLAGMGFAHADDQSRPQSWSLGGAALSMSDSARITMWTEDVLSAGIAKEPAALSGQGFAAPGLQTGGFLAWQSSIYRVDATLSPSIDGQMALGLGASIGEAGTRYGMRVGTSWASPERITLAPSSGYGLADWSAPNNSYNVSFMIHHALTPNLTLMGLAEAQRSFGVSPLDGNNSGLGRLVVGAGLGYKF